MAQLTASLDFPGLDGREILSSPPHSTKEIIRILWGLVKANGPTPQGREKSFLTSLQEGTR
jgi:hypothetical protein